MAFILNIDTSLDTSSVCLARDNNILFIDKNQDQKDHASWLHPAIQRSFENTGDIKTLDAVAVTIGPGSYTGLRVGLATAKGICFALGKPLITCNTLFNMALSVREIETDLLCPMIDARRMEVFAAVYTSANLEEIQKPVPMILNENSFKQHLKGQTITFFGNGSNKFKAICDSNNAVFRDVKTDASSMITYSEKQFSNKIFADLAYVEPDYLKEFNTTVQ
jgi:tRNA threonylcarbamoyladenosine biosynthesis protein TsaB